MSSPSFAMRPLVRADVFTVLSMRLTMRLALRLAVLDVSFGSVLLGCGLLAGMAGCGGVEPVSMLELVFDPIGTGVVQHAELSARAQVDLHFTPAGGPLELAVDCLSAEGAAAEDPDRVGIRFTIEAPGLALAEPTVARAGSWKFRDSLPATATHVRLLVEGGPASCELRIAPVPAACGARETFRSAEVGHEHVAATAEPRPEWEPFPVSGNHYATWAAWNTFYVRPIRTGYLLHDLEHGGIVFSYRCSSPSESVDCTAAANNLMAAKTRFNQRRSNVTPDPAQPSRFAARAWRWAYLASCYDEDDLLEFANRRFRKGREDVDSNSFPEFDPTL